MQAFPISTSASGRKTAQAVVQAVGSKTRCRQLAKVQYLRELIDKRAQFISSSSLTGNNKSAVKPNAVDPLGRHKYLLRRRKTEFVMRHPLLCTRSAWHLAAFSAATPLAEKQQAAILIERGGNHHGIQTSLACMDCWGWV